MLNCDPKHSRPMVEWRTYMDRRLLVISPGRPFFPQVVAKSERSSQCRSPVNQSPELQSTHRSTFPSSWGPKFQGQPVSSISLGSGWDHTMRRVPGSSSPKWTSFKNIWKDLFPLCCSYTSLVCITNYFMLYMVIIIFSWLGKNKPGRSFYLHRIMNFVTLCRLIYGIVFVSIFQRFISRTGGVTVTWRQMGVGEQYWGAVWLYYLGKNRYSRT